MAATWEMAGTHFVCKHHAIIINHIDRETSDDRKKERKTQTNKGNTPTQNEIKKKQKKKKKKKKKKKTVKNENDSISRL